MRHFLAYWKPNQIPLMVGKPLDHAGSAQFRRVSPGDVVWIVTVHDGRLKLLGRIWVTDVVSRRMQSRDSVTPTMLLSTLLRHPKPF